jgi:solute carrier family 25 carnitine/acylcarnitine transporter 20/29
MFMSNGYFRRIIQNGNDTTPLSISKVTKNKADVMIYLCLPIVQIGMAGSLAGSVMAFLNCPIELLKVKLQTQDPKGVIGLNGKLEPPVRTTLLYSF